MKRIALAALLLLPMGAGASIDPLVGWKYWKLTEWVMDPEDPMITYDATISGYMDKDGCLAARKRLYGGPMVGIHLECDLDHTSPVWSLGLPTWKHLTKPR